MQGVVLDLTGRKFGKLLVKAVAPGRYRGYQRWIVQCDCGSPEKIILTYKLLRTNKPTQSCGCGMKKPIGEAAKNKVLRTYKKNAKKSHKDWGLSGTEFFVLTQSDCHYCGTQPSNTCFPEDSSNGSFIYNGIDRVDNLLGYIPSNVVPCCKTCNWAKGKIDYKHFTDYLRRVAGYWGKKQTITPFNESKVMVVGSH